MRRSDENTAWRESSTTKDENAVRERWRGSTRRTVLKTFGIGSAIAFGLTGTASAVLDETPTESTQEATPTTSLIYRFQAVVTTGPSEERAYTGRLELTKTVDGALSGTLILTDNTGANAQELPVTGQIANGNIALIISLDPVTIDSEAGSYLFTIGHGTETEGFEGTFVGPESGDSGQWDATPP